MSFQMTRTRQDATTNLAVKRHLQRWRITGNRGGRRITKTWRRGCRRRRRCCSGRQCWWWWHLGFTRVLQSSNTGKKIERVPVFSTSWRTETRQRCRRRWTGGLLFTHSTIRKKKDSMMGEGWCDLRYGFLKTKETEKNAFSRVSDTQLLYLVCHFFSWSVEETIHIYTNILTAVLWNCKSLNLQFKQFTNPF